MSLIATLFMVVGYFCGLLACGVKSLLGRREYADWVLGWQEESEFLKVTVPIIWWYPLILNSVLGTWAIGAAIAFGNIAYLGLSLLFFVTGCYLGFKSWIDAWQKGQKTKFDPYYSLDIFGIKEDINQSVIWLRQNNRFNKFYPWILGILIALAIGSFVGLLGVTQRFVNGDGSRVVVGTAVIFLSLWGASVLGLILTWLIKLALEDNLQQKLLGIFQYYRLLQQRVKSLRS